MHGIFETVVSSWSVLKARHVFNNQACELWMGNHHKWNEEVSGEDSFSKITYELFYNSLLSIV